MNRYEPNSGWNLPPGCFEDTIDRVAGYVANIDPGCPVMSAIERDGLDMSRARSCLYCEDPCPYVRDEYPFMAQAYPLQGGGAE